MGTTTSDLKTVIDVQRSDDVTRVVIIGNITAESDLSAVKELDAPRVILDVGALNRFNSRGVLLWMQMLDILCKRSKSVEIWNAGHAFMQQYAMIRRFVSSASIESVRARVCCERCGATAEITLERKRDYPKGRAAVTTIPPCNRCRTLMTPDDEVFELDLSPDKKD